MEKTKIYTFEIKWHVQFTVLTKLEKYEFQIRHKSLSQSRFSGNMEKK